MELSEKEIKETKKLIKELSKCRKDVYKLEDLDSTIKLKYCIYIDISIEFLKDFLKGDSHSEQSR